MSYGRQGTECTEREKKREMKGKEKYERKLDKKRHVEIKRAKVGKGTCVSRKDQG
jgi:hypothetical protein